MKGHSCSSSVWTLNSLFPRVHLISVLPEKLLQSDMPKGLGCDQADRRVLGNPYRRVPGCSPFGGLRNSITTFPGPCFSSIQHSWSPNGSVRRKGCLHGHMMNTTRPLKSVMGAVENFVTAWFSKSVLPQLPPI